MSPEQFAGVGVDIRSDLYSLGVTLWVMVTCQTPFRDDPDATEARGGVAAGSKRNGRAAGQVRLVAV